MVKWRRRVRLLLVLLLVAALGGPLAAAPASASVNRQAECGAFAAYPQTAALCQGGMLTLKVGSNFTQFAMQVLAVASATGAVWVTGAAESTFEYTGRIGRGVSDWIDVLKAGTGSTAEYEAAEVVAGAVAAGKAVEVYDPDLGISGTAYRIGESVGALVQAQYSIVPNVFTANAYCSRTALATWNECPGAWYRLKDPVAGQALYIGAGSVSGFSSLWLYNGTDGMSGLIDTDAGETASPAYVRVVRDDGVIVGTGKHTPQWDSISSIANLDMTHAYYVIAEDLLYNYATNTYKWYFPMTVAWGTSSLIQTVPVVLADEVTFSDYQGSSPKVVAVSAPTAISDLTEATPVQVAQVSPNVTYVTNETTNIYNPPSSTTADSWTAEAVQAQITASERAATAAEGATSALTGTGVTAADDSLLGRVRGIYDAVVGIPAAIAGIPTAIMDGLQGRFNYWFVPTIDIPARLGALADSAGGRIPLGIFPAIGHAFDMMATGETHGLVIRFPTSYAAAGDSVPLTFYDMYLAPPGNSTPTDSMVSLLGWVAKIWLFSVTTSYVISLVDRFFWGGKWH